MSTIAYEGGIFLRTIWCFLLCVALLCGCSGGQHLIDRAMMLRSNLQTAKGCSFDAVITADYGDQIYTFAMGCQVDAHGNLFFTVLKPESITGIEGFFDAQGGKLTFDGHILTFPMLADGQVTPVSAPWIMYQTLIGGYFHTAVQEDKLLHVQIDDSYEDHALQLDIWLGEEDLPVHADVLYQGRRILTIEVEKFEIL